MACSRFAMLPGVGISNPLRWVFALLAASILSCSGEATSSPDVATDMADTHRHRCGNGICDGNESCTSCPQDCGTCRDGPSSSPPDAAATDAAGAMPPDAGGVQILWSASQESGDMSEWYFPST